MSVRAALRDSIVLAGLARVFGTFAPPILWAYVAATLPDDDWSRLTPSDRWIVTIASPLVPLLTLAGLAVALAGLATGHLRGDLLWIFLTLLVAAFGAAMALRSVLQRISAAR